MAACVEAFLLVWAAPNDNVMLVDLSPAGTRYSAEIQTAEGERPATRCSPCAGAAPATHKETAHEDAGTS